MQEKRRKIILSARQELTPNEFVERAEREGIELEKGAVITNEYLERHYDELCKWVNLFTAYPDYYLDIIKPKDSEFTPKNVKNASDFESMGELCRWLEKRGFKNPF